VADTPSVVRVFSKGPDGKVVGRDVPESFFFFNYWHGECEIPPVRKESISYTNIADKRKR